MAEYIEREALVKDMRDYADCKAACGHIELANGILKGVGRAEDFPTADVVEVKHGYWHRKHIGNGWDDWDALTCSECNKYYKKPLFPTNYCPNCGAKMDLKEGAENDT